MWEWIIFASIGGLLIVATVVAIWFDNPRCPWCKCRATRLLSGRWKCGHCRSEFEEW